MEVVIFEKGSRVLRKVAVSGGGRCNCTNTFEDVEDLSAVYPRGHRLMKRLFNVFNHNDAADWFERHGVTLTAQADHRIFPSSQDSQTIIDCFLNNTRRLEIKLKTNSDIHSLEQLSDYDFVAVTTGGCPKQEGLHWLEQAGHKTEKPVPSLFTFNIPDQQLRNLMGTTIDHASTFLSGRKYRSEGSLLITHWGVSGPAILKLSSHEARTLADNNYRMAQIINWTNGKEAEVREHLQSIITSNSNRLLTNYRPFELPQRLWDYLADKSVGDIRQRTWASLSKKEVNRMVNNLCNDEYAIAGKGAYKEEFVTCGGISLKSINPATLESRTTPHLFFAGEILDVDGITGGFNFQAAWTTAYTVAQSIAEKTK